MVKKRSLIFSIRKKRNVILERVSHIKQAEAKEKKGACACGRLPEGKMKVERKKEHNASKCVRNTT
jgi:hypothetical protein